MKISSGKIFENFSDEELLEIMRNLTDEVDEKLAALKNCKKQLEGRGWQFVNWPEYEKKAS